ncbi:hypothetical protein [Mycobacterium sp.]|uniref:hypothetical protein n=1 Tax=Mycobacterium sp. TaxID=1785 RepID=UPI003D11BFA7
MPADATGEHANAPPRQPASPVISAASGQILITGTGLLPNQSVTLRIISEDIVDYLTYVSDANGCLCAPFPEAAISGTKYIAVTDHRTDSAADDGLLWSNTVVVMGTGV